MVSPTPHMRAADTCSRHQQAAPCRWWCQLCAMHCIASHIAVLFSEQHTCPLASAPSFTVPRAHISNYALSLLHLHPLCAVCGCLFAQLVHHPSVCSAIGTCLKGAKLVALRRGFGGRGQTAALAGGGVQHRCGRAHNHLAQTASCPWPSQLPEGCAGASSCWRHVGLCSCSWPCVLPTHYSHWALIPLLMSPPLLPAVHCLFASTGWRLSEGI